MQTSIPLPRTGGHSGAKRPKRWQRWLVIPALLVALGGGAAWWQSSQVTTVTTTTATVSQGNLAVTVSGSGSVAAARTVAIPFQQTGTVTSVDVQIGDQVTAGQALATIDATDLQLALQLSQANLATAEAQLAQVQNGTATEQDIATAQAQLTSAQAQLEQTQTGTTTAAQIASAQAQLTSAQTQLAALQNPTDADRSAAQRKVDEAQLALQSTRDSASQSKTNAELALQNAVNSLTQSQVSYATAKGNWDYVQETGQDPTNPESTDSTGKVTKNKLNDTQRQQYYDSYAKAEASLQSAQNSVTQAQVAYDAARQSEVLQIEQAEASAAEAQANMDALLNPSATDLAQAKASVASAKASLASLTEGATTADLASAEASVTQAQSNLDDLMAPATDAELASAQATVLQAQVAVDTAQASLDEATLTAPFAGVVSAVDITLGSTTTTGTAAVTIVDQSIMHVAVSLSESDSTDVQVGQPVALTFDALPEVTITGTVESISPVASTDQNVVTYATQIAFDPGTTGVKVGMSATADIQVEQATNAILVPSRAIQTTGDTKTVTVLDGENEVTVPVEIGLVADGKTEIISSGDGTTALEAGDTVVVPSTSTSTNSASTNQSSSVNLTSLTGGSRPAGAP